LSANDKDKEKTIYLGAAYYETLSALKSFKSVKVYNKVKQIGLSEIIFFDANPCVKTLVAPALPMSLELKDKVVMIVDTTSATMEDHARWYDEFVKSKLAALLFFVASGLKHEQISSDRNPYGTVRVFAKDKAVLTRAIEFIKTHEKPMTSQVSHEFRRFFKLIHATPSNQGVIKHRKQKPIKSARP
jgi:hypothetical protein